MSSPSVDLLSFRRAFALLLLLVVLPSAGLSAFGVVAIVNERAAVEKRLEESWGGKLDTLTRGVLAELRRGVTVGPDGFPVVVLDEGALTDATFTLEGDRVESADPAFKAALTAAAGELQGLTERPEVFSVAGSRGSVMVVARREGGQVRGARISAGRLTQHLAKVGSAAAGSGPTVRLEVRPTVRTPKDGLIGQMVSQVADAKDAALAAPEFAERALPPPMQDFKVIVLAVGDDPVARASTRNRIFYALLLSVLYGTLAVGVVYIARTLYREARLSRMKTDFVSLVSHELRTPLTSIRMFVETLSMGRTRDPAQTQEVLGLLGKEAERLSGMIEHVLDWARIESGRKVYQPQVLAVKAVIDKSVDAFRAQRLDAAVDLSCELSPDLKVKVDPEALAGALLNLIQNAFKYGGDPKRIAVRAHPEPRGVAIEVEDNGEGIPIWERRRIFERFYRVDSLLTRKTEGSGLGLSIAKRIVEAHGGRISLKSTPGQGSCFTVHLPQAPR